MLYNFLFAFLVFFIYSIIGYFVEVITISIEEKRINFSRGYLLGPYIPVFGFGAILMISLLKKYQNDIFVLFGLVPFSIKGLIQNSFPITFKSYWFMTAFIVLYIFTPFINALLNKITEKEHKKLCIIGTILFILLSTLTTKDFYGNELIQFILFYNIGAYFGKYKDKIPNSIILLLSSILIIISSIIIMDLIGIKYQKIGMHSTFFLNRNSIIALLLSLSLFFIFIKMEPAKNIFINHISKYVLGIYLISDNPLIRNIIWKDIFKNQLYVNSNWLPLHMLLTILIIFLVCIMIDFLRTISIEKIYIKIINKFRHTKSN